MGRTTSGLAQLQCQKNYRRSCFRTTLEKSKKQPLRGFQIGQTKPKKVNRETDLVPLVRLPYSGIAPEENSESVLKKNSATRRKHDSCFLSQTSDRLAEKRQPQGRLVVIPEYIANQGIFLESNAPTRPMSMLYSRISSNCPRTLRVVVPKSRHNRSIRETAASRSRPRAKFTCI